MADIEKQICYKIFGPGPKVM